MENKSIISVQCKFCVYEYNNCSANNLSIGVLISEGLKLPEGCLFVLIGGGEGRRKGF